MNGVKCNFVDISDDTLSDVQESIAFVLDGEVKRGVAKSEYFGLIIDESTDISVHKKLAECIRYVADRKMVTKFLTNVKIQSGTAESIVHAVKNMCCNMGFDMHKLVGFGSDGASVMTGKDSGVVDRLRRSPSPHLVAVHCLAHRLSLACTDAAGDVRYVSDFKSNINKLYSHFSVSANRQVKLEAMYEVTWVIQL